MLITKREEVTKKGFCEILWRKLCSRVSLLLEFINSSGWNGGERLFEFDWGEEGLGAYSRWALIIRGWALFRIIMVVKIALRKFNNFHVCEFMAHHSCKNTEMNLKSTTTHAFNFRIINSLIQSWGVHLTCLDCTLTFTVFPRIIITVPW